MGGSVPRVSSSGESAQTNHPQSGSDSHTGVTLGTDDHAGVTFGRRRETVGTKSCLNQ
jgi:hypothetical protein